MQIYDSDQIKWIFGFCTATPCITEGLVYIDLFWLKKTYDKY